MKDLFLVISQKNWLCVSSKPYSVAGNESVPTPSYLRSLLCLVHCVCGGGKSSCHKKINEYCQAWRTLGGRWSPVSALVFWASLRCSTTQLRLSGSQRLLLTATCHHSAWQSRSTVYCGSKAMTKKAEQGLFLHVNKAGFFFFFLEVTWFENRLDPNLCQGTLRTSAEVLMNVGFLYRRNQHRRDLTRRTDLSTSGRTAPILNSVYVQTWVV